MAHKTEGDISQWLEQRRQTESQAGLDNSDLSSTEDSPTVTGPAATVIPGGGEEERLPGGQSNDPSLTPDGASEREQKGEREESGGGVPPADDKPSDSGRAAEAAEMIKAEESASRSQPQTPAAPKQARWRGGNRSRNNA